MLVFVATAIVVFGSSAIWGEERDHKSISAASGSRAVLWNSTGWGSAGCEGPDGTLVMQIYEPGPFGGMELILVGAKSGHFVANVTNVPYYYGTQGPCASFDEGRIVLQPVAAPDGSGATTYLASYSPSSLARGIVPSPPPPPSVRMLESSSINSRQFYHVAGGAAADGVALLDLGAYDTSAGAQLWSWPNDAPPDASFDGVASQSFTFSATAVNFVSSVDGAVYPVGVHVTSGRTVWNGSSSEITFNPSAGVAAAKDQWFFMGPKDAHLVSLRGSDGKVLWSLPLNGSAIVDVPTTFVVAAHESIGVVCLVVNTAASTVTLLAVGLDGKPRWSHVLAGWTPSSVALDIRAAIGPSLDHARRPLRLFLCNDATGAVEAFDAATGLQAWSSAPNACSSYSSPTYSSVGVVTTGDGNGVVAFAA